MPTEQGFGDLSVLSRRLALHRFSYLNVITKLEILY